MPRYDFECPDCGARREVFMRMAEYGKEPVVCNCGGEMERDFSDTATGMITVEGGASPTRFRSGHKTTPKHVDEGFNKELDSIWEDMPGYRKLAERESAGGREAFNKRQLEAAKIRKGKA